MKSRKRKKQKQRHAGLPGKPAEQVTRKKRLQQLAGLAMIGIIFLGIIMCENISADRKVARREAHRAVTQGYVFESYYSKGWKVKYHYTYKGVKHNGIQSDPDKQLAADNCYLIELDSLDPGNAVMTGEWVLCRP